MCRAAKNEQNAPYAAAQIQQLSVITRSVGRSCGRNAYSSTIPANDNAAMTASRRAGRLRGITQDSERNLTALCFAGQ